MGKLFSVFIAIALLTLSGCASMFGSSSDMVTIRSTDPYAQLQVNGSDIGQGSAQYKIPRGKEVTITAMRAGCQSRSVQTEKSIVGWTWLNIFVPVGFLVDVATGKINKTDPTDYIVNPFCTETASNTVTIPTAAPVIAPAPMRPPPRPMPTRQDAASQLQYLDQLWQAGRITPEEYWRQRDLILPPEPAAPPRPASVPSYREAVPLASEVIVPLQRQQSQSPNSMDVLLDDYNHGRIGLDEYMRRRDAIEGR